MNALEITKFLNDLLDVNHIEDSSSNGLQLENSGEIEKIGFAVDACLETFQKAKEAGCNMIIVHHGLIWDGLKYIKGNTYRQIKYLIENNMALYAAHLPLDKHETYGNNAGLAQIFDLKDIKPFGFYHGTMIGCYGNTNLPLDKVKDIMKSNGLKTESLDFGPQQIKKIAIISGGASSEVYQAAALGVDLYITGEPLHFVYHFAKENNLNVIFGGHYETEVFGVKALMPLLSEKFKTETVFIDVPTTI